MAASRLNKRVTFKVYSWAEGFRVPKKHAESLGAVLDEIKQVKSSWTAADIVSKARPKASPIHAMFEWNDKKAAELHRQNQAREYVRHLEVEIRSNGDSVKMQAAVSFGPGEGYNSTEQVMEDADMRARLVAQALKEAESWKERWKHLSELADIFERIEGHQKKTGSARRAA